MSNVFFNEENRLGIITLNRDSSLNALTLDMIIAIKNQLKLWENKDAIKVVVIKSNPESKAFCAGGDIRWIYEAGLKKDPQQEQFFKEEYDLNFYIHSYKKPYIAIMDGITMGGGAGISLHGSYPIATERFSFAMPETGIGFFPDIGASYFLTKDHFETGVYLGLTGNRLNAQQALTLGLVRYILDSAKITKFLDLLKMNDFNDNPYSVIENALNELMLNINKKSFDNTQLICEIFSKDTIKEIFTALKINSWSQKLLNSLEKKAPLSLCVTLNQFKKAKSLNLRECLDMDYHLVKNFIKDHDFYEGIRALIIDKDKNPKWNPATLNEITTAKIQNYFEYQTK